MITGTEVYVVISGYDYESSSIEKVFDSQEKAEAYLQGRKAGTIRKDQQFDWIDYESMVVE